MKENNIFYTRLKELIDESDISANRLEKDLGYSRNTLQNYKNGQEPSASRLMEISDYFAVSPRYLVGDDTVSKMCPVDIIFKRLSPQEKKELTIICQNWLLSNLDSVALK